MDSRISFFIIVIFSSLIVISCGDSPSSTGGDNDPDPPGNVPDEVSYSSNVQPIFTNNCGTCHIGNTTSGVNLTDFESVMSSVGEQYDTEVVLPGNAEESPLVDKISSNNPRFGVRMPQGGSPLSSTQIAIIRDWINDGAQNN